MAQIQVTIPAVTQAQAPKGKGRNTDKNAGAAPQATPETQAPKVTQEAPKEEAKPEAQTVAPSAPPALAIPPEGLRYALKDTGFRPTGSGPMGFALLAAHTEAFFKLTGMYEGKAVPSLLMRETIGARAMTHHKDKFATTAQGYVFTEAGKAFFAKRIVNQEFLAAYLKVMSSGEPDGQIVKNKLGVYALPQAKTQA